MISKTLICKIPETGKVDVRWHHSFPYMKRAYSACYRFGSEADKIDVDDPETVCFPEDRLVDELPDDYPVDELEPVKKSLVGVVLYAGDNTKPIISDAKRDLIKYKSWDKLKSDSRKLIKGAEIHGFRLGFKTCDIHYLDTDMQRKADRNKGLHQISVVTHFDLRELLKAFILETDREYSLEGIDEAFDKANLRSICKD